jgi:hypothetical protein
MTLFLCQFTSNLECGVRHYFRFPYKQVWVLNIANVFSPEEHCNLGEISRGLVAHIGKVTK